MKISHAEPLTPLCCLHRKPIKTIMNASRNASAVREPSGEELQAFTGLRDILVWASIKGNPDLHYTQAGSLLYAMAADEFRTIRAEEFASVDPVDFEECSAQLNLQPIRG